MWPFSEQNLTHQRYNYKAKRAQQCLKSIYSTWTTNGATLWNYHPNRKRVMWWLTGFVGAVMCGDDKGWLTELSSCHMTARYLPIAGSRCSIVAGSPLISRQRPSPLLCFWPLLVSCPPQGFLIIPRWPWSNIYLPCLLLLALCQAIL